MHTQAYTYTVITIITTVNIVTTTTTVTIRRGDHGEWGNGTDAVLWRL
jgi:hypothetical protein